jgi:hypothetical protein
MIGSNTIIIRLLLITSLFIIVVSNTLGEKVYNDGAGWDGLFYRHVAYTFTNDIVDKQYNSYYIQRIAPFAILNIVFSVLSIAKTHYTLLIGMNVFNIVILLLGVYWFFKVVSHTKFTSSSEIIFFSLLFYTFPVLKLSGYYPFLTDPTALVLGIGQLRFYLEKKDFHLFLVSAFGAFVWPTSFLVGMILLLISRDSFDLFDGIFVNETDSFLLDTCKVIAPLIPVAFFVTLMVYCMLDGRDIKCVYSNAIMITSFSNPVMLTISLLCIYLYGYFVFKLINTSLVISVRNILKNTGWKRFLLFFIVWFSFHWLIKSLANSEHSFGISTLLFGLVLRPTTDPFVFLECHFVYFGLMIPLLILFWKDFLKWISSLGYAFSIVMGILFIFSFTTESRTFINLIPFLLYALLISMNKHNPTLSFALIVMFLNLLISRFWYRINTEDIVEAFSKPGLDYLQFPAQRYFMNFGPWQSHEMYYLFMALLIACFFFLRLLMLKDGVPKRYNALR